MPHVFFPSDVRDVQGYGYEEDRDPRDGLLSPAPLCDLDQEVMMLLEPQNKRFSHIFSIFFDGTQ